MSPKLLVLAAVVGAWEWESEPDPDWALKELGASSTDDVASLVLLSDAASQTGAKCLDGSPASYYIRPGAGDGASKWYIHHQGGGWCTDLNSCLGRSNGALGSSTGYGATKSLGGGYFSQNSGINPMMHNWNSIFLNYCDGGSFSGLNDTVTQYNGAELHFRGRAVLDAIQQDLLTTRALGQATDVVISGCSAGGLSTYLHVDQWASLLPSSKVVGLPDSGFFLDYVSSNRNYHAGMQWVFEQMNSTSGVNQKCIQANADETWKCIFAEHTSPHIDTPMFPLQGEYDSWQLGNVLGNSDVSEVNAFGQKLTALVEANLLGTSDKHGIFLDSCKHHCGGWGNFFVNGKSQPMAFQEWYEKGAAQLANKGYYTQAKAFECTECCAPQIEGANVWKQVSNPVMNQSGVEGYRPVDVTYAENFGGLEYNSGHQSLLDGQPGLSTWWYTIGTKGTFKGGIPGPVVAGRGLPQPVVELFVRNSVDTAWVLVMRQTDGMFFAQDEFAKNKANPNAQIFAALDELEFYRQSDGTLMFKLQWPQPTDANTWLV